MAEKITRGLWPSRSIGAAIPVLAEGEVHLWIARLAVSSEALTRFKFVLSSDERARAQRFHTPKDSDRFITARALLRHLLGTYLAITPDRVSFTYNAFGKPGLADGSLHFNVSHSKDWGLFGFARKHQVGVDLEFIQPDLPFLDLAERYFTSNELKQLLSLPVNQQRTAFYCGWTRKEAYLKARGDGLSSGLNRIEVTLTPGEAAAILKASDDPHDPHHWTIQHLSPVREYLGAAAINARQVTHRLFTWDDQEDTLPLF